MKKLLLAAVLLAGTALATPASAATIANLGVNPNSATGHFSHAVFGTTFTDEFTFQLVGTQFVTFASATNDFSQPSDFITSFTGQLFKADQTPVNIASTAHPCTDNPTGCQELSGTALLLAGDYFLRLTGIGGGTSGYGGDLTVSQVPLPGALALFASGLVGLGLLRRRKSLNV